MAVLHVRGKNGRSFFAAGPGNGTTCTFNTTTRLAYDVTLYFTAEELRDMCQRIVGKRGYTFDLDVLEHLSS